jgi:hypothetical protein
MRSSPGCESAQYVVVPQIYAYTPHPVALSVTRKQKATAGCDDQLKVRVRKNIIDEQTAKKAGAAADQDRPRPRMHYWVRL